MEHKKHPGLTVLGVLEALIGLVSLRYLYILLTFEKNMGVTPGLGWLFLPLFILGSFLLPLGIGILLKKKIMWFLHIIGIPLMLCSLITVYIYLEFTDLYFWVVLASFLAAGLLLVFYLTRPEVRKEFK